MITFKSPIWDSLLNFVDSLRDFPDFESMHNGALKSKIDYIYDRAIRRMRIDKTDFDMLSKAFVFLSDKNIDNDLVKYMNENDKLGYKCITTADGERIIKEAEAIVKQRERDEYIKAQKEEALKKYKEAEERAEKYNAEHNKITDDLESAKRELDAIMQAANEMNVKTEDTVASDTVEEVKDNE